MLHLRFASTIEALSGRLVGLLEPSETDTELMVGKDAGVIELVDDPISLPVARKLFRQRLQDKLYRSEALVRIRLKYVLARFCMVSPW